MLQPSGSLKGLLSSSCAFKCCVSSGLASQVEYSLLFSEIWLRPCLLAVWLYRWYRMGARERNWAYNYVELYWCSDERYRLPGLCLQRLNGSDSLCPKMLTITGHFLWSGPPVECCSLLHAVSNRAPTGEKTAGCYDSDLDLVRPRSFSWFVCKTWRRVRSVEHPAVPTFWSV